MAPLPPPPPPPPTGPPVGTGPGGGRSEGLAIIHGEYDTGRSTWGLGDAALSLLIFFVVSSAAGILAVVASDGDVLEGAWLPVAIGLAPILQGLHITWLARARGRGLGPDFGVRFRMLDLGTGLAMWLSGMILAGIVAAIMLALTDDTPTATAAELAQDTGDETGLTVWIIAFAVLGSTVIPFVEELVYRGLWWSALEKRGLHPVVVLLVTSTLFAAIHLEPFRFPILFVIGLALGLGRLVTGRIAASVVAHVLINAIAFVAILADVA